MLVGCVNTQTGYKFFFIFGYQMTKRVRGIRVVRRYFDIRSLLTEKLQSISAYKKIDSAVPKKTKKSSIREYWVDHNHTID